MKWFSKQTYTQPSNSLRYKSAQRRAIQCAVVALIDVLEPRMLLASTFVDLTYTDPFPAAAQLGQPSQSAGSVLYSESFTDQTAGHGVLGTTDPLWNGGATVTRPLPAGMQNGLGKMSVEFWIRVGPGTKIGGGPIISMPGFEVDGTSNFALTPAGVVGMRFFTTRSGEPVASPNAYSGIIADGQWHQYTAVYDGQKAYFYTDGQLTGQSWLTNTADKAGPLRFAGTSASRPTAITYSRIGGVAVDEVRVSNVALTPWQVQRNYENARKYTKTWFVSPTGKAGNSGTRSAPIDLPTAMSRVGVKTKIVLLAGTYKGAQFKITGSGEGALNNSLITGDDGIAQVIIQSNGNGAGATVSAGAKYVTLRNLTFRSDQQPGLQFSGAGIGNIVDGCRITSKVDALSVVNSSGFQDPLSSDRFHYINVPGVTLQNSVLAPGSSSAGVRYDNSKVIVARNNTFTGGQYGAVFSNGSTNVLARNNIFTGQSGSGVYFAADSVMNSSIISYQGDGNIYNPASGGYVASVVDGGTNNFSTVSDYAKFWYSKQHGAEILRPDDSGAGIGSHYEKHSILGAPVFTAAGDFRLAAVAPNLIDTGVASITWDGQGNLRAQGNGPDAGAYETVGAVNATFNLATAASTSAGVYDGNDKLIRTLWSGIKRPAGPVKAFWNGLDDNNNPMPNGNYSIKMLGNNVTYVWNGATNNSNPLSGPNVQSNFYPIQSMLIIDNTAYYNAGFNEGRYAFYKFALSNIHQTTGFAYGPSGVNDDYASSIASDGTKLYAIWNPIASSTPILRSYDLDFTATGVSTPVGATKNSAISIAVQPAQQNLVFVSHPFDNKVYIYNKGNFTPYSTPSLNGASLGWNTPLSIATTPDGDLWVTCKNTATGQWQIVRYSNFAGTPTLAATVTGGLVNPLGIAVSLDGQKTLMVADGESGTSVSQQIKAYTPAGASLWTLGQAGGYAANGPTITNDKFILQGMIAPQADGSFWITDLATQNRTMHFSAARTFIEDIQYARSYVAAGDQNNATRVFQNFVEYKIDYSKPYTQNQGWTPVKNWNYLGTKNLLPVSQYGGSDGLATVATLSNGRTYAMVNAPAITGDPNNSNKMRMVELTATGLRDTGYMTSRPVIWMDKDGSLTFSGASAGTAWFLRLPLTGFDASGNPQYAANWTTIATAPFVSTWDAQSPASTGLAYYGTSFLRLDTGQLVSYNPGVHNGGMHLGMVNPATNQWQWQSMPAGPFDGKGNFDTNGWYGGNRVMANGRNIVAGYNGEGWVNNGQANQFIHYYDNGLFVGQFGTPSLNGGASTWPNPHGFSGNTISPFVTSHGTSLYIYANDESNRNLQRWQATGVDTIQVTSVNVSLAVASAAPSGLTATAAGQTQINLVWTDILNHEAGFKVERATNSSFTQNLKLVTTTAANATSYSNTGLTANTLYYYRVRATNSVGDSADTATASTTTHAGSSATYEAESGTLGGPAVLLQDDALFGRLQSAPSKQ